MSHATKLRIRRIAIALIITFCATPLYQTSLAAAAAPAVDASTTKHTGSWVTRFAGWTYQATKNATKKTGTAIKKASIFLLKDATKFACTYATTEASRYLLHAALRATPYEFSPQEIVLINSSDRALLDQLSPEERKAHAQKIKTVIVFLTTQCVNAGTLYALSQMPALKSDHPEYFVYPFIASHAIHTVLPCSKESSSVWRGALNASDTTVNRAALVGKYLLKTVQIATIFSPEIADICKEKTITGNMVYNIAAKGAVVSALMIGLPYVISKLIAYLDNLDDDELLFEELAYELEQLRAENQQGQVNPGAIEHAELLGLDHCTSTATPH